MKKIYYKVRTQVFDNSIVKVYDYIDNEMILIYENKELRHKYMDDYDHINKHIKQYHDIKYPLITEFTIKSL